MKGYLKDEQGMTLIEVMVAISLFSIVLIPILNYFANSTKVVHQTEERTIALHLAQGKMEELKSSRFHQVSNQTEDYESIATYPNFKRVVKTSSYNAEADIKQVTVTIYWDQDQHTLQLTTLIAER